MLSEDFRDETEEALASDESPFTYTGSRQEARYLLESLDEFLQDQWITDVLFKVKGGKEANVYCCAAGPGADAPLLAAKVYRPRMFRAMHNDWVYKQGRTARDAEGKSAYRGKSLRAAQRGTRIGRQIDMASWCRFEHDVLAELHSAGADVPRVWALASSAILMQYIGDEVRGAPVLHAVALDRREAHELYARVIANVELFLQAGLIHADLSAHNILYHDGRISIIDWPQAVKADTHPQGYALLSRDIERICQYFARQGVECDAGALTASLWRRFVM